jgi:hypothetical protein
MKLGLVTLLAAILLLSCEDGGGKNDYNPNYREPMVWGLLSKVSDIEQEVSYQKDFEVFDFDGLRMVPTVLLNDSQVETYFYSPTEYDYGDTNVIPTNRRYDLEVRHYWGTGFCHLVMPGDFELTLPPRVPFDTFVLGQRESLASAWRASRGAQWYWLSVYVNYDYYDTLGAWDNREFRLDTLMHDTWIIVPPEQMFPPVVGEVIEGDASVTIWSGNGPPVEPGDLGNIRGAAVGFVNAVNEPPSKYFYVGARRAERRAPDGRAELERFKARLRSRLPSH